MLLNEKISIIRKMNNLSQERFAEELGVSRQAVSKWENGCSIPDTQLLIRIADYYNLTLDQLVRDEYDLPISRVDEEKICQTETNCNNDFDIKMYLGKICDVSMNSFRYNVIRNIKIVGIYKNMVCFEKKKRYGYFNINKILGIVIKKEEEYVAQNELLRGKCTAYVNKGSYFGGNTFLFSTIEDVTESGITIHTGEFVSNASFEDLSVIQMTDSINC